MNTYERFNSAIILGTLVFAIFTWYDQNKFPEIKYTVQDPIIRVFDKRVVDSKLLLLDKDSMQIRENVNLAIVQIWNSGKIPVDSEHVRKPFICELNKGCKVVDARIIRSVDSTFSKYNLKVLSSNQFKVSWSYFDPGSVLSIQLFYQGDCSLEEIKMSGSTKGSVLERVKHLGPQSSFYLKLIVGMLFIFIMIAMIIFEVRTQIQNKVQPFSFAGIRKNVVSVTILIYFIYTVYKLIETAYSIPLYF